MLGLRKQVCGYRKCIGVFICYDEDSVGPAKKIDIRYRFHQIAGALPLLQKHYQDQH